MLFCPICYFEYAVPIEAAYSIVNKCKRVSRNEFIQERFDWLSKVVVIGEDIAWD